MLKVVLTFAVCASMLFSQTFSFPPSASGGGGGGGGTAGGGGQYSVASASYAVGTWFAPPGGGAPSSTTEAAVQGIAAAAGTVSKFGAAISVAPGAGNSVAFTWRDGGVDQTVTCTISGASAKSCVDATHTFAVAANDLVDVKIVVAGATYVGGIGLSWVIPGAAGPPGPAPAGTGIVKSTSGVAGLAVAGTDYVSPAGTETLTNKTVDGVSPTTFGFVDPTSSIQTQINAKAPSASPTITGHPTIEGVTSTGATGTGKFVFGTAPTIAGLTVTGTLQAAIINATGVLTTNVTGSTQCLHVNASGVVSGSGADCGTGSGGGGGGVVAATSANSGTQIVVNHTFGLPHGPGGCFDTQSSPINTSVGFTDQILGATSDTFTFAQNLSVLGHTITCAVPGPGVAAGGTTSVWSGLLNPTTNLSLAMGTNTSTFSSTTATSTEATPLMQFDRTDTSPASSGTGKYGNQWGVAGVAMDFHWTSHTSNASHMGLALGAHLIDGIGYTMSTGAITGSGSPQSIPVTTSSIFTTGDSASIDPNVAGSTEAVTVTVVDGTHVSGIFTLSHLSGARIQVNNKGTKTLLPLIITDNTGNTSNIFGTNIDLLCQAPTGHVCSGGEIDVSNDAGVTPAMNGYTPGHPSVTGLTINSAGANDSTAAFGIGTINGTAMFLNGMIIGSARNNGILIEDEFGGAATTGINVAKAVTNGVLVGSNQTTGGDTNYVSGDPTNGIYLTARKTDSSSAASSNTFVFETLISSTPHKFAFQLQQGNGLRAAYDGTYTGFSVSSAGALTATSAVISGAVSTGTLTTNITGSAQCLHVNTSGVVSGTGSDCGAGGGGSGTVTVVGAGNLTSTALVTGGGTQLIQTPSATATMDTSGNISTPGTVTSGAGGSVAGFTGYTQGTLPTPGANELVESAPVAVTAYNRVLPGTAGSGFLLDTNVAGVVTQTRIGAGSILPKLNGGAGADMTNVTFPSTGTLTLTIASGTVTLGTAPIAANTCASVVTVAATGTLSTDTISWTPNGDISGVTGYGVLSTDGLIIYPYPTAGNVNMHVCNATASSITPGAATLNFRVTR